jgi:hypothetical protein
VVDPLVVVTEMQLTPSVSGMDTFYGLATAISGDGTRAIVGSVDGASVGRVFIYLRTGATWTQERVINAPMTAADCRFGQSVALSRNGAVAIVGAPNCLSGTSSSAAFIYARTGTTWALDQRLPSPEREFGDAVAITADGTRALIGAPLGGPMVRGEAYVFLRGATTWALESSLPPAADAGNDGYGGSVALAADGTRAVVGMPRHDLDGNNDVGSAHFFVRSGTTWTREADIPAPVGFRSDFNEFGRSVAMSSDGTRTLIGSGSGGWVYLRGTGGWAFEAQLADAAGDSGLGTAVALSSNGNRALLGGLVGTFGADIFVRSGTTWALGGRLIDPAVTSDAAHGSALSISDNGARAIVGAPNTDVVFRNDGTAFVYTIALAPAGTSCTSNAVCASGFCTDGVCCNNACNGTCRACVSAETGIADGTCAPLSAALAPTITCRPSAGVCDVAEICSASSETCPTDDFVPSSMVCNASTGEPCDVAEFCTGTSAACPTDVAAPMGTVCRAAAPTSCDAPEVCNGTAKTCPTDVNLPEGAVCRPVVSGGCDVAAETCSGTSSVCPPDSFAPAATVCRPAVSGGCDLAERCTGTSNACPADAIVPAGTSCRPEVAGGCDVAEVCNGTNTCPTDVVRASGTMCRAAAAGGCDVPETCNGSAPTCPVNTFAPNTRICRMAAAGGCDVPESCTGTGAACPTNLFAPATLVCRGAADACDVPESCTGTAAACPSDSLAPSTTTCRAAVPGGCDVPETCSGSATACPPDVFQPNTTVCRTVAGDCDVAESCTGASNACPIDGFLPASSICREAAGACDAREVCDGGGPTCPGDLRVPTGTPCGGTGLGSCSSPGVCNGSSVSCPGSTPLSVGTICVPRVAGNPCDLDDVCDGVSDACVARFADATAPCGSPVSGDCDAPDHCAGPTSATCIVEFLSGDVCRPSTGVCDPRGPVHRRQRRLPGRRARAHGHPVPSGRWPLRSHRDLHRHLDRLPGRRVRRVRHRVPPASRWDVRPRRDVRGHGGLSARQVRARHHPVRCLLGRGLRRRRLLRGHLGGVRGCVSLGRRVPRCSGCVRHAGGLLGLERELPTRRVPRLGCGVPCLRSHLRPRGELRWARERVSRGREQLRRHGRGARGRLGPEPRRRSSAPAAHHGLRLRAGSGAHDAERTAPRALGSGAGTRGAPQTRLNFREGAAA